MPQLAVNKKNFCKISKYKISKVYEAEQNQVKDVRKKQVFYSKEERWRRSKSERSTVNKWYMCYYASLSFFCCSVTFLDNISQFF